MKVIKYLIGLAAISGILLFGLKYYTEGSYGEIPGILDQLNPLVEKGEVYVKTQKPEEVNEYGTARYVQKAADANGKLGWQGSNLQLLDSESSALPVWLHPIYSTK